jgi:hypothetical protein
MSLLPVLFRRQLPIEQPAPETSASAMPSIVIPAPRPNPDVLPPAPATGAALPGDPTGPAPHKPSEIPPRWAVALVALVLILASVLVGLGHPVSIVMEALAGSGYLSIELIRLLNKEL